MKNKIYKICKDIANITEAEIREIEEVYNQQLRYHSPLKMATTRKQHELGNHNKKMLEKVLELKQLIESQSN